MIHNHPHLRFSKDAASNLMESGDAEMMAIETELNNNAAEKPLKLEQQTLQPTEELPFTLENTFKQILNLNGFQAPTRFTSVFSVYLIVVICMIIMFTDVILAFYLDELIAGKCSVILLLIISFSVLIFATISLSLQPRNRKPVSFQVPLVPVVPLFSVMINLYLMLNLSTATWLRFLIWMAFGLSIYFFYGISNSNERFRNKPLQMPIVNGKELQLPIVNGKESMQMVNGKEPVVKQAV